MSTENPFHDQSLENKPSTLLRTATILSIIGSVLAIVTAVTTYINAEANYEKLKKMASADDLAKAPEFVKSFVNENAIMAAQKAVESKLPLMVISLIGAALCLMGAILMRKLKKDGLKLWMTGEILPVLSNLIFLGVGSMTGLASINLFFPAVFISIYLVCRKELVK